MFKKILAIVSTALIICLALVPIVSAEEFIIEPIVNGQLLYQLLPSVEFDSEIEPYNIYGYDVSNIITIDNPNGFVNHYRGNNRTHGDYYIYTYSTVSNLQRSRLNFFINSNDQITVWYELYDTTNAIASQINITILEENEDFAIVVSDVGEMYMYYFDSNTKQPLFNRTGGYLVPLTYVFYGDIYLYGRSPSDYADIIGQTKYAEGYANGLVDGYANGESVGYAKGISDATPSNADIQAIYDRGYNDGHQLGYASGLTEGARLDNESVYNLGLANGQEQAQLIPQAVSGFFESTIEFFQPFLSIGFGQLTLFNLLGVMVIVALVVIIVKIVRG